MKKAQRLRDFATSLLFVVGGIVGAKLLIPLHTHKTHNECFLTHARAYTCARASSVVGLVGTVAIAAPRPMRYSNLVGTGLHPGQRRGLGKQRHPSKYWIVLKTKQASSRDAVINVRNQTFEYIHPLFRKRAVRGIRQRAPIFPYYLLVRIDETKEQDWKVLSSTKGVSYVIAMSGKPSVVPNDFVRHLKKAINNSADGYYPDLTQEDQRFERGDIVEGVRGLFEDKYGTYIGLANEAHRVRVLFSILGKDAEFEVRVDDLRGRVTLAAA